MSAICGIVHLDGKPADQGELETMVESSPYRGPDGTGYHLDGDAGFAHLAFHVTPESVHEKQPLVSDDGRFVLCVDARLDNRDELQRKLDIRPQHTPVVTDPDLVLAAWLRWDVACVEHLLGDFVFSVWDTRERRLFLARDPLGAHCVHYHRAGDAFVFASAISAILDLPFVTPVINEHRVLRQIEFLPCSHQETFFESVHYLPPAHCLEIRSGTVRQWRYWDIDPERRINYGDDQQYADQLLELVQRATADRMRSIGPVGVSLSGGYDSTLIAACGARSLPGSPAGQQRLKSFSYVFRKLEECDESAFIDPVVAQYDLDAHPVIADRKWSFRHLETQPIERDHLWINPFRQLPDAIARAAREQSCRVLLDGQYGDPLFSGANLNLADLLSRWKLSGAMAYIARHRAHLSWRRDVLGGGIKPLLPGRARRLYRQLRPVRKQALIGGLREDKLALLRQIRLEDTLQTGPALAEPGRRRRYRSLMSWAWPQGLAAGRAPGSARFGFELLSPYFDRRIVEFILAVPSDRINTPQHNRFLQANAMRRVLPAPIWQRAGKTSFERLLELGLGKERTTLTRLLADSQVVRQGWIREDWLREQLQGAMKEPGNRWSMSMCVHLELWLRGATQALEGTASWAQPYYNQKPNPSQAPCA